MIGASFDLPRLDVSDVVRGDLLDVLPLLDDASVDAVVTSPPYADARPEWTHNLHVYGDWAYRWLAELARVTAPTGSLMLNLGRIHRGGVEVRYWEDVLRRAEAAGWFHFDTIVWHKVNGGGGRRTAYLIDRHEYVFWLVRSLDGYRGFDEARVPYAPATIGRYARRWSRGAVAKGVDGDASDGRTLNSLGARAGSVFVSAVGSDKGTRHPTPMQLELAEHLVKLSCPVGGLVLDPFAGACTTAVAARRLGRRCRSIELEAEHCSECEERLAQQVLA